MIIPVYKPLGKSTHQLARALGDRLGEKATHTGTLDPMAEGVVVVLTGEDRLEKGKLSQWQKTYQFQMLLGVATDSLDLLGLIEGGSSDQRLAEDHDFIQEQIAAILPEFLGSQKQKVPSFSAKRLDGKSYFDAAKAGKVPPAVEQEIEIFSLEIKGVKKLAAAELLPIIHDKISTVEGDFRQKQIDAGWKKFLKSKQSGFFLANLRAITSRRAYIRGLVRDLGRRLELPTTTFSIVRTQNGPYAIADSICLL